MIMPSMRTWEGEENNVTAPGDYPGFAEALRRHQYCGVILFVANVTDTEQTLRLTDDEPLTAPGNTVTKYFTTEVIRPPVKAKDHILR